MWISMQVKHLTPRRLQNSALIRNQGLPIPPTPNSTQDIHLTNKEITIDCRPATLTAGKSILIYVASRAKVTCLSTQLWNLVDHLSPSVFFFSSPHFMGDWCQGYSRAKKKRGQWYTFFLGLTVILFPTKDCI